ncbi:unnamed protein product [Protopolystoma xenopodis]|uniref:Uncharacterized protein n=1 Tax=Protopolystoma xenopodis TaxID=117903 RepID=A0A448X7L1_9PLAT|nr:unnamed protein product [Protopolystoma xenopodis]
MPTSSAAAPALPASLVGSIAPRGSSAFHQSVATTIAPLPSDCLAAFPRCPSTLPASCPAGLQTHSYASACNYSAWTAAAHLGLDQAVSTVPIASASLAGAVMSPLASHFPPGPEEEFYANYYGHYSAYAGSGQVHDAKLAASAGTCTGDTCPLSAWKFAQTNSESITSPSSPLAYTGQCQNSTGTGFVPTAFISPPRTCSSSLASLSSSSSPFYSSFSSTMLPNYPHLSASLARLKSSYSLTGEPYSSQTKPSIIPTSTGLTTRLVDEGLFVHPDDQPEERGSCVQACCLQPGEDYLSNAKVPDASQLTVEPSRQY